MNARVEWARHLIAAAPDAPSYGSPEWLVLPEASPAKVAAVVRAAECWAVDGDELEARLRIEVMALSRVNKREEDAEYSAHIRAGAGFYDRRPDRAEVEAEFWDWVRGDQRLAPFERQNSRWSFGIPLTGVA